jgi:hypothetical protein
MSTPNVGYGFVPCSHDDPKRSHYWDNTTTKWHPESDCMSFKPCPSCSKANWRKPVEIPDGWELVPEDSTVVFGDKLLDKCGPVCTAGVSVGKRAGSEISANIGAVAFIRRKSVQPTVEPSKPAVDWSKPLQLKDGRKARFLALIKCPEQPRCCVVTDADGDEWVEAWCENGNYTVPGLSPLDIINTPERIERDVWLTLYRSGDISTDETEEAAKANRDKDRVACVRVQIDCNVGEGL